MIIVSVVMVSSMSLFSPNVTGITISQEEDSYTPPSFESNFTEYFDYNTMTSYLKNLEQRFPDLMYLFSIGRTYEGREIWCAKLSDNVRTIDDGNPGSEPNALLVGAHHGNEWISYETALYVLTYLLEFYGHGCDNGTAATYLMDNREIYIVPMLNADGTQYAHETDRGWRKNREPNYIYDKAPGNFIEPDLVPSSYGTDINRNYGWMWHELGGSNIVIANGGTYRGPPDNVDDDGDAIIQVDIRNGILPGPDEGVDEDPWDGIDNDGDGEVDEDPAGGFSTRETQAIRELGDSVEFPVSITYHSYSELILWPWGFESEAPPDGPDLEQLGTRMAEMNGYRPMQGYELYPVTGEFDDWFYSQYGTFSYTFEIGKRHTIPAEEILEHTRTNIEPAKYLIYSADNRYKSYLRTDENSTRVWRAGNNMRVEFGFTDEGYPIPWDDDSFSIVYRWENGPWKRTPLDILDNGNLTGIVPIEMDEGKLELYIEMIDGNGNVFTEPAYAPYSLITFEMKRDSIFSLYFGFDTMIVMLFTLGIAWGGFTLGLTKSIRSQRKMEG